MQVLGAGAVVGLAGCLGGNSDDEGNEPPDESDDDHDDSGETAADEPGSEGIAYVFTPDTVALVDVEAGEMTAELSVQPGGRDWGDVRRCETTSTLFAVDSSLDQVVAVDLDQRELLDPVDVGSSPIHAYLAHEGELWVHADGEGRFYVIETDTRDVVAEVEAGLDGSGHGKLVHHESLSPYAYATNVNDPVVAVLDVEERARVDEIELDQVGGTHYIEYTAGSERLYVEYQGIETAVIDPEEREVVDGLDLVGGMATDTNRELLALWGGDELQIIDGTDTDSGTLGRVTFEGESPDSVEFAKAEGEPLLYVTGSDTDFATIVESDGTLVEEVTLGDSVDDRAVDSSEGYYLAAGTETTLTVVSTDSQERQHEVDIGESIDAIRYVPMEGDE